MTTKLSNPKDLVGSKKPPLSPVPANVLFEVGAALLEGSCKYGRHNYRDVGVRAEVYYDAALRHLMVWWEGEDIDPDSGLSHITKAIAGLVVLRDAQMNSMLTDDRPPKSKPWMEELSSKVSEILDNHKEPKAPFTERDHGKQEEDCDEEEGEEEEGTSEAEEAGGDDPAEGNDYSGTGGVSGGDCRRSDGSVGGNYFCFNHTSWECFAHLNRPS